MPPKRESDHLLERLRTVVRNTRRGSSASSIELEARSREIEHLKSERAEVVRRTAGTTTSSREVRQ